MGERFGMIPERVMRDRRLHAWDWRVLLALLVLSRRERGGQALIPARVRVSTLVKMLGERNGSGKRQVLRALERLESFGYVKRMRRGRVNTYDVNPTWNRSEVEDLVDEVDRAEGELAFGQPVDRVPKGDTGVTFPPRKGDTRVTQTARKGDTRVTSICSDNDLQTTAVQTAGPDLDMEDSTTLPAWERARRAGVSSRGFLRAIAECGKQVSAADLAARVTAWEEEWAGHGPADVSLLRWMKRHASR